MSSFKGSEEIWIGKPLYVGRHSYFIEAFWTVLKQMNTTISLRGHMSLNGRSYWHCHLPTFAQHMRQILTSIWLSLEQRNEINLSRKSSFVWESLWDTAALLLCPFLTAQLSLSVVKFIFISNDHIFDPAIGTFNVLALKSCSYNKNINLRTSIWIKNLSELGRVEFRTD